MSLVRETDPFLLHQYSERAMQAAARGDIPELLEAIEDGADVNFVRVHMTPLQVVLNDTNPNWEVVKVLLDHGADVNVKSRSGWGLLHQACDNGWEDFTQMLLDHAVVPFAADLRGITPLHVASEHGFEGIVAKLIATGIIEYDGADFEGETAVMKAARGNHLAVVKQLVAAGADLTLRNEQGLDILAISDHDYDIQDYLRSALQVQTWNQGSNPEEASNPTDASSAPASKEPEAGASSPAPAPSTSGLSSIKKRKLG